MTELEQPTPAPALWIRHCEACGREDLRERFESAAAADADGVWERPWSCQECGGNVFSLEETPEL